MKQIILNIENTTIENLLYDLSKVQNKSIEMVIVDLLKQVVELNKQDNFIKLKYDTLDPEKHMTKINYYIDNEVNTQAVFPFNHVSNSAEYIKSSRKNCINSFDI